MAALAEALGLQGVQLLVHQGNKVQRVEAEEALKGVENLAVYFSAHWCPPCRAFTPVLSQVYERVRGGGAAFQVLFVSADRDPAQFQDYWGQMPWLALPYDQQAAGQRLSSRFGVMGIPRLVIVGADGQVVASDARSAVMADRSGAQYPWTGAAGPTFLQGLLSPRSLFLLFLLLYWLSQWLTKKD